MTTKFRHGMEWKKFFIELRVPVTITLQIKFNIYKKKQIKLDFRPLTTKGFLLLICINTCWCLRLYLFTTCIIYTRKTQIKNIQM